MALRTVRVPPEIAPRFAEAEEIVSRYFRDRRDDPEHGTIEIFGERYVLVRAASLSVEFFTLVEELFGAGKEDDADAFAKNILFDLAHAIGRSDAHNFHSKMGLSDPIARLSAGPVHFAHAGWAFVDISPASKPSPDEDFFLLYEHPYSFESDAWVRARKTRKHPACIMNAGYSSGWCQESFGVKLVAVEVACRAKGDESCRFVMAHPDRIEAAVARAIDDRPSVKLKAARAASYDIPDFFARKRIEEELRAAKGDLERRVRERTMELTRAIEERQKAERKLQQAQKLEAIGRLAGGIAHDFNNLMAIIIGNAGLLARRLPEHDETHAFLDEISAAGRRAASLTQQLLAFSRGQVIAREVIDLAQVVNDLSRMLARVIGEEIELEVAAAPGALLVEGDRGQLEQVVMNLVVNARDAMMATPDKRGGHLTIEVSSTAVAIPFATEVGTLAEGRYAVLVVTDTGTGMDEETLSQIFDPFFTTKRDERGVRPEGATSGTGLGLATVYAIVKQSRGGIVVTSAPGKGSRFAVYLPLALARSEARAVSSPPKAAHGSETILVVEDQEPLRAVIAHSLRDLGYSVLEAHDGVDALVVAEAHAGPIHVLLTDVVMPRMRGPELADRLVAQRPEVKVLYMSGYADDAALAATGGGGVGLLAKPFAPDALGRKVRELIEETEPASRR